MTSTTTLARTSSLYEFVPHLVAGSLDSTSAPFAFETPPQPWHYTLAFKGAKSAAPATSDLLVVRVTLEVQSGIVAVGVLRRKGSDFLDEVIVGAGESGVADILVGDPATAGRLMVRNGPAEGTSRGRILGIECFTMKAHLSSERELGLSFPRATPRWNRVYGAHYTTLTEKVRARMFETLTAPEIVRWSDGLVFRAVPNDQISRVLYVSDSYEPNTLCMLRKFLRPGGIFLDVGANAGVFSLMAARCVGAGGHVYSFEPSQREHGRLCDAIQLNHLEGIITPVRAAVGEHAGHVTLRVAQEPYSGHNTLGSRFSYDGVETSRLEPIEMTTLDEFDRRHELTRVDLIKLDIEGAESAALAGGLSVLRRHRPVLVIEVFSRALESNGASVAEIQAHLRNADYRAFAIDDNTAELTPLADLTAIDEQNIVAVPAEQV